MAPPLDSFIDVYFKPERLDFTQEGANFYATLNYKTGLDKNSFVLKAYHPEQTETQILERGANVLYLNYKNITDISGIETVFGVSGEKDFVNGEAELSSAADWSIDIDEGIIYTYTTTSTSSDTVVTYKYQLKELVNNENWKWNSEAPGESIIIHETKLRSFNISDKLIGFGNGATAFHLPHFNVLKDTVRFDLTSSTSIDDADYPFAQEVDYIDGFTEFGGKDYITKKGSMTYIGDGDISDEIGISLRKYELDSRIASPTDLPVVFEEVIEDFGLAVSGAEMHVGDEYASVGMRHHTNI
jgi:hypothetical protein